MTKTIQPAPDWFDRLWDSNTDKLPLLLRNDSAKQAARGLVGVMVEALGKQATTPEGIQQVVAYARILASVKGIRGVMEAPDPSPAEVADFVERLVQRAKP